MGCDDYAWRAIHVYGHGVDHGHAIVDTKDRTIQGGIATLREARDIAEAHNAAFRAYYSEAQDERREDLREIGARQAKLEIVAALVRVLAFGLRTNKPDDEVVKVFRAMLSAAHEVGPESEINGDIDKIMERAMNLAASPGAQEDSSDDTVRGGFEVKLREDSDET